MRLYFSSTHQPLRLFCLGFAVLDGFTYQAFGDDAALQSGYFEFRQIFAQAEKSGSEGGWGRLSLHLRRKLAAQREFLEGAFRAADTNGRGMLNRAQIRRVLSSHVLTLTPSEIEQAISGY